MATLTGVFFSGDQLFGMEELSVSTGSDFIDDSGFQIDENSAWHMFARTRFTEEGVERIITSANGFI